MRDEELTALAARAFGNVPVGFSPLTDDGDALRLAVRLGINIYLDDDEECSTEWNSRQEWAYVEGGTDMWAAVRLAITRAAAEIGRNMP